MSRILGCIFAIALAAAGVGRGEPAGYDPLALRAGEVKIVDLMVNDAARKREVPVRVFLPADTGAAPVVLFSHGLGGSREGNGYLGKHWAGRGYVCVFLQHHGSDSEVWRGAPLGERMNKLRGAANAENFILRIKDVAVVLDTLAKWNGDAGHPLAGRLNMEKVGMSGHSFGAVTTQAVSGQRAARGELLEPDARIDCALAMSPSSPALGSPERAFGKVSIPWLLMTGTKDVAPIGNADVPSRLAVFNALPPGDKFELVLDGAAHSAFGERALPTDPAQNPNHHKVILALSSAFWDAFLKDDKAAKAWLASEAPKQLMQAGDSWKWK